MEESYRKMWLMEVKHGHEQCSRIIELEQLCRDMYKSLDNYSANIEAFIDQPVKRMSKECAEATHSDVLDYSKRMDALGLLEGGDK